MRLQLYVLNSFILIFNKYVFVGIRSRSTRKFFLCDSISRWCSAMRNAEWCYILGQSVYTNILNSFRIVLFFRYMFAAAHQGHLPPCFSCLNMAHDSPRAAIFAQVSN